jgi:hypothetical protein
MDFKRKASVFSKITIWPAVFFISLQLFFGMLAGYLTAKFIAGKETGKQGKIRSLVLNIKSYRLHLHHWLLAFGVFLLAFFLGYSFIYPRLFYGVLAGLILQGLFNYGDWHKIIKKRKKEISSIISEKVVEKNKK